MGLMSSLNTTNPTNASTSTSQSLLGVSSNNNSFTNQYYTQNIVAQQQQNLAQQQQTPEQTSPSVENVFSTGKNIYNIANPSTGSSSGLLNSVNQFGNEQLGLSAGEGTAGAAIAAQGGFASGLSSAGSITGAATGGFGDGLASGSAIMGSGEGVGAFGSGLTASGESAITAAAPSWTAATFSSVLGDAGIGAGIGGLTAGLFGENVMGGTIGGAIGGVAGGLAGGALLGAELGSFAPGVGTVIGAVAGGIIGGLFGGGKPSDQTQVATLNVGTGQIYQNNSSDTGGKYSQNNRTLADTAEQGASNLSQWLLANGATLKDPDEAKNSFIVQIGNRSGDSIGTSNNTPGNLTWDKVLPTGTKTTDLYNATSQDVMAQYNIPQSLLASIKSVDNQQFYSSSFNLQGAIANPSSITGQQAQAQSFATPTVNNANSTPRQTLQTPVNNPTGASS